MKGTTLPLPERALVKGLDIDDTDEETECLPSLRIHAVVAMVFGRSLSRGRGLEQWSINI